MSGEQRNFWSIICRYAAYLYLLLMVVTVLLLLNVFAFLLADQEPGAYVITVVNFFILGGTWVGLALLLWNCNRV